jgi:hypothetical protein
MNYFKVLGIVFGLAALLKPFYMHLLPWDENQFIEKFYSEKRPPKIQGGSCNVQKSRF